ncbi:hypothetical protein BD309DRAFT_948075 [Dichomitus squalens]|uniref:Uncharacterized protein n=1 Tax=Dichomitus squalens TaxID=114155 RepID=A0A4Q9N527_9APHY|nr:hypothetical protein BD311DRAFT_13107 [Dichomitus squalens]TBU49093.1 hypothetical protein BD309DRAFT_948075 [Dichomitus squalens]
MPAAGTSGQPALLAVYRPASHDDASSPLPSPSLHLMLFRRSNHFTYQLPTYTEWTRCHVRSTLCASQRRSTTWSTVALIIFPAHQLGQARHHLSCRYESRKAKHSAQR